MSRTGQNGEGRGEIQARTASADSYGSIQCYVSSQKGPGVWLKLLSYFAWPFCSDGSAGLEVKDLCISLDLLQAP